tara:strand:- start:798 stop:1871 length:1074 start_codon:yes stop_codon:yes gene_type:complete
MASMETLSKERKISHFDIANTMREKLNTREVQETFQNNASVANVIEDFTPKIKNETPQPILNIDSSPTPERENGKARATFFAVIGEFGILSPRDINPIGPFVTELITESRIHSQLRDHNMTNLEIKLLGKVKDLSESSSFFTSIDGSVAYLSKKYPSMVNNDDFDFPLQEAKTMVDIVEKIKPLGFVKHTEVNYSCQFIDEVIKNSQQYLHEKELNDPLLKPGQVLYEIPKGISANILKPSVDAEYSEHYARLLALLNSYRTVTYKPLNGSEVVRIEFHISQVDDLPKIIKSIDFDKRGSTVEPYCQFRSDTFAKHFAKVAEQLWMKKNNPYLGSDGNPLFPLPSRSARYKKSIGEY